MGWTRQNKSRNKVKTLKLAHERSILYEKLAIANEEIKHSQIQQRNIVVQMKKLAHIFLRSSTNILEKYQNERSLLYEKLANYQICSFKRTINL